MNAVELSRVGAVVWKDLTAERRARVNFNSVIFFAALMLLLFGFALGPDTEVLRAAGAGIIWLTVLYSGVLVFSRSYQIELEGGAMEALLLYPGERKSIFLGKVLANVTFVLLVELVVVPVAAVLYHLPVIEHLGPLSVERNCAPLRSTLSRSTGAGKAGRLAWCPSRAWGAARSRAPG